MSHCFIAFQRKDPCYRNKNNTYLHQMKLQMTKKEKSKLMLRNSIIENMKEKLKL